MESRVVRVKVGLAMFLAVALFSAVPAPTSAIGDASASFVWIRQSSGEAAALAVAVAVEGSSVYVAGGEGLGDGFLWKFDSLGTYQWGAEVATEAYDEVHAVTADASGAYAVGSTDGVMEGSPGTVPSNPYFLTAVESTLFFVAEGPGAGYELWKSDGAHAGTVLVKDLNAEGSSFPSDLTAVGSVLYFVADNGKDGRELWKSNGTSTGTVLVRDIVMGSAGSWPSDLTAMGSTLFFTADDGKRGRQLWKSDGTSAGTVILTTEEGFGPSDLTSVGSTLFFTATRPNDPYDIVRVLWKSDGTSVGTVVVFDVNMGGPRLPFELTAVGSLLFFRADSSSYGEELWKSDGTPQGTVMVEDILPDSPGSFPSDLTEVDEVLYFSADSGTVGRELWRSDGTPAGTRLIKDINPNGGSGPADMTGFGNSVLLTADDGVLGRELWISDGWTTATLVVDLRPEFQAGSFPSDMVVDKGGDALFVADDGSGPELWRSDGTAAGTNPVPFAGASPDELTVAGSWIFFSAADGTGRQLWKTAGTTPSTVLVKDGRLSPTGTDALVQKFSTKGSRLWIDQFGTSGADVANGVASDGSAVYVVGATGGSLPGNANAGGTDAFIRKYNANGAVLWTRQFGTPATDVASAVAGDGSSVYVAGSTSGTLPGQTPSGGEDAFLRMYDASGTEIWTVQFGTAGADAALSVAFDSNAVYVAGQTADALGGQPSSGGTDAFLRAHDPMGNVLWTTQFGTSGTDIARAAATDGTSLFVTGSTNGALPGQASAGGTDAFLLEYGLDGTESWAVQFGGPSSDQALALAVEPGAIFVAGSATGSLQGETIPSGQNAFLARVAETPDTVPSLRASPADRQVGLAWDPPASDGGQPVTGYRLYRGTDPTALDLLAVFDAGIRTYADRDIANGVTYHYRISAVNAIGEGPPSNLVSATPRAPPFLTVTSPTSALTSDTEVTVAGATESDATVTIDGTATPVSPDGTFSRTLTLANGLHRIEVVARDPLGQTTSAIVSIAVDTIAPSLVLASPADGAITDQTTLEVAGTTEAGATLVINGLLVDVSADGAFAFDVALKDGTNIIDATASDLAGNTATASASVIANFAGGPPLSVTSPTVEVTNRTSVTVAGVTIPAATVTVNGISVAVSLDGGFTSSVPLVEGPNTIAVVASSDAGSTLITRTVTRDTSAPALALASPAEGESTSEPTTLVVGTTEPGASMTVNGIVAAVGADGSFSMRIALANGTNGIVATARDVVGNARTVLRTVTYVDPLPGLQEELAETRADLEAVQDSLEETRRELDEANRQLEDTRDALSAASSDLGALGDQLVLGLLAVAIVLGGIQAASLVLGRKKPPRTE